MVQKEFKPNLVEHSGMCRFCKQMSVIKVPEGWKQDLIDEEATKFCTCCEAQTEQRITSMIASGEMQIREFFKEKDMPEVEMALNSLVEPMARMKVSKISINSANRTISMKRKKGGIEVGIKVVTEEKVEA